MLRNSDFISAVAFMIFGSAFAGYAAMTLRLGTFSAMGPGLFPAITGGIVACLGALQLASMVLRRETAAPDDARVLNPADWKSFAIVIVALAAFAILVAPFGLAPAILTMTLIASLASKKLKMHFALLLGLFLLAVSYVIFIVALGLSFKLFEWPF